MFGAQDDAPQVDADAHEIGSHQVGDLEVVKNKNVGKVQDERNGHKRVEKRLKA